MRTIVYVDGFNLYYGAVKGTPYRWLDLGKLFKFLLPLDDIVRIRYFTALVQPTPDNPQVNIRQNAYLRAIGTIPNFEIHYGTFLTNVARLPRHPISKSPPELVDVVRREEKGSDVNLAAYLLLDCFRDECDKAVVVSADSDLALPVELARNQFGKRVEILVPTRFKSAKLRQVADSYRTIRRRALASCQFRPVVPDRRGREIRKPDGW